MRTFFLGLFIFTTITSNAFARDEDRGYACVAEDVEGLTVYEVIISDDLTAYGDDREVHALNTKHDIELQIEEQFAMVFNIYPAKDGFEVLKENEFTFSLDGSLAHGTFKDLKNNIEMQCSENIEVILRRKK